MTVNLQELLRRLREERAARVRQGSDQEAAWHAIVPERFRQPEPKPEVDPCQKSLST
jgi:hypothetical protein